MGPYFPRAGYATKPTFGRSRAGKTGTDDGEHAGSDWCVFPPEDVIASRERINLPGSMPRSNWIEQSVGPLLVSEGPQNAAALLARFSQSASR